jgi:hypothetical protein
MGGSDVILIIFLFLVLGGVIFAGTYVFLNYTPYISDTVELEGFGKETQRSEITNGSQFYPNLRYRDRKISYNLGSSCSQERRLSILEAFEILSEKTVLSFEEKRDGEISFLCSEISPKPSQEKHFVAGEGGPSDIIDAVQFNVIFDGKVALYRGEKCEKPLIALHEIIHALGFDHNDNRESIMYPVTSCGQELDQYIIDTINRIYEADSLPDLSIDEVSARKTGRLLSFEINVSNVGLKDVVDSSLIISSNDKEIRNFDFGEISIGTKKFLQVDNMRLPSGVKTLNFRIKGDDNELDLGNNIATINIVK